MPEISAALARALKRGDARFLLFYCDHPVQPQYLWSRVGTLQYAGHTYHGVGVLGSISGSARSVNLAINEVTFELRGVPATAQDLLSDMVRNRVAQVTLGAMSKRGRVTVDDEPIIDALLDYQRLSVDPSSGTATIRLVGQQGFFVLDRAQDLAWSDQQQRSEYPDDSGMALTHLWVDRESNWRSS